MNVELSNWRGVMARPGMSAEARAALSDVVKRAYDSEEWKEALANNGWEDQFLTGDEFGAFVKSEEQRVNKVLREIGLVT
jgi:putative tricarboxylic transport membrane protein